MLETEEDDDITSHILNDEHRDLIRASFCDAKR